MPHGDLYLYVEGALNIKNTAFVGRCSPYCILTVGTQAFKTEVATDGGSRPYWNQTFEYKIDRSTNHLMIKIMAKESLRDDDLIGECNLAFVEVFREKDSVPVTSYPVTRGGKHHGDIRLGLNFHAKKRPAHVDPSPGPLFQPRRPVLSPVPSLDPVASFDNTEDSSSNDGSSPKSGFGRTADDAPSPQSSRHPSYDFDRPGRRTSLPLDLHPPPAHQLRHAQSAPTPAHAQQQPPLAPFPYLDDRRCLVPLPHVEEYDAPVWSPRRPGPGGGPPSRDGSSHGGSSHGGWSHGGSGHGSEGLRHSRRSRLSKPGMETQSRGQIQELDEHAHYAHAPGPIYGSYGPRPVHPKGARPQGVRPMHIAGPRPAFHGPPTNIPTAHMIRPPHLHPMRARGIYMFGRGVQMTDAVQLQLDGQQGLQDQVEGVKAPLEEQGPNWRRGSSSSTQKDGGEIIKDGYDKLRDEICDTIMRDDTLEGANDLHGNIEHDYEAFKGQLYEDIKRIDCIEELPIDSVDTMFLLHCHDTIILSFFDENEDKFEFYFKNREDMASIVGVGLEHAVAILESGDVTIKEVSEEDWNERWRSVETNSCEKRKLFKMTTPTPSNAYEGLIHLDVELSYKKPLLWELTKYFSLKESIETFVTKDIFVEYAQGVKTSSPTSFENQGEGSVLKGTWKFVRWLTNGGLQENGNEGSTSSQYEERVMEGSEDTATIVKLQLLHEGLELKDENETMPFSGTIKSNLQLQFINEGGDGKDGKEVHILVGTVSFKFGRDNDGNQLPWYHENLRVMFGLLNEVAQGYGEIKDESFVPLNMTVGTVNMKMSSTHGHTKGKESIGKGGLSAKPHGVGLSGEYQQKWSSQDIGMELSERSAEISNDDYTQGGLILKSSVDEFRIVCDYSIPKEVPFLGPPSSRHFFDQDVKFQGVWLPKGDGGLSLHLVEYTLQATRALCHKDKQYQQTYKKTILVNHSMTHLDGKTYRLQEKKIYSKSILREIGSGSEPEWREPLVEMKDIPNEVPDATIQNVDQQTNNRSTHNSSIGNRLVRLFGRGHSTSRTANSLRETLTPDSRQESQQEVNGSSIPTRRDSMRW